MASVISEDLEEVIEWLLKWKEETGKMNWDDAAWHISARWGRADHKDPDWAAWRCPFQGNAAHKYRFVS